MKFNNLRLNSFEDPRTNFMDYRIKIAKLYYNKLQRQRLRDNYEVKSTNNKETF